MTRRIAHLIEEQQNQEKLFKSRDLDIKVGISQEYLQKTEVPILDREEVLPLISRKESHQCEVTLPNEDKNQNGKRNPEMKLIRKKARKISKKRDNIEKLQKVP
jgi:hypothetical protein